VSRCATCRADVPDDSRFCPRCGAAFADSTQNPTHTVRGQPPPQPAPPSTPRRSSGASGEGRFLPGTVLAGRYRIFGLVGKGGMGEVYRADDLKLGQAVALKFLPVEVEQDAERLGRFLDEVRIARQISHPNVCRVYDVGEVDGHHFLSMEFVDGEDLASLLRRIGRLPRDKAIQIARQMCAGLAAAHEQGILHRDLKPSNVMIDGRGRARITDFGLARLAGEIHGADVGAGTPAYMAPEQIDGREVTARSDIYALGLVLYEICTGQMAFRASTPAEMARLKNTSLPTSPAQIVEGLDPAVGRAILRCLERDPANRPASALLVAAALPGGDPLAAALAAGETPSPELIAEAGAVGGLSPAAAWACLAGLALGVVLVVWICGQTQLTRLVPLPKSPDALADRAHEIVRTLGYRDPVADSDRGFEADDDYLAEVARGPNRPGKWDRLRTGPPFAIGFYYREGPQEILTYNLIASRPSLDDPPIDLPGMVGVRLDPEGRLRYLRGAPAVNDATGGPAAEPDWNTLLGFAGLDLVALHPVEPAWIPPSFADRRAAWEGTYPAGAGPAVGAATAAGAATPVHVEAAALRGRPVAFRVTEPWNRPGAGPADAGGGAWNWQKTSEVLFLVMVLASMAGGALLARRNLRLGRGDRKGAYRLVAFVVATGLPHWLFRAHHVSGPDEVGRLFLRIGYILAVAALAWSFYLALEPFFRRLWPETMVSWVRLLDGRLRDPLVGRDVLLGLLAGPVLVMLNRLTVVGPTWIGLPPVRPDLIPGPPFEMLVLAGPRGAIGLIFAVMGDSLVLAMALAVLLLLCRLLFRRTWLAGIALVVAVTLAGHTATGSLLLELVFGALAGGLLLVLLFRFGFLVLVVGALSANLFTYPMTFDSGAWYAGNTLLALVVLGGLAIAAFRVALAGHSALGDRPDATDAAA